MQETLRTEAVTYFTGTRAPTLLEFLRSIIPILAEAEIGEYDQELHGELVELYKDEAQLLGRRYILGEGRRRIFSAIKAAVTERQQARAAQAPSITINANQVVFGNVGTMVYQENERVEACEDQQQGAPGEHDYHDCDALGPFV
ncbi:hypothetical protein DFS34DRAFT_598273 [Phlyctochytrium arcticum]|nr:hypothetical protein DFS34DRAFT_598273 [Phlyctochytrium arcticum]